MRKTRCLLIALISFMPLWAWGDNYSQLWKQVEEAKSKDLPRTEISLLNKIIEQAEHSGNNGHLLKAQLMRISVRSYVAPDSLSFDIERLKNKEAEAVKKEHWVLAAIYESALGRIYKETPLLDDKWWTARTAASSTMICSMSSAWKPMTTIRSTVSIVHKATVQQPASVPCAIFRLCATKATTASVKAIIRLRSTRSCKSTPIFRRPVK